MSGTLQGAGGIGGLLARTDNSKLLISDAFATAFYHADGNGNVTYLIYQNQTMAAKYLYDPYGNTLAMSGPLADANTYRFSSKEWNANSGLYYYLYRFYDSNLQRWPDRDAIAEWGGFNLYRFVANSCPNAFDIWGEDISSYGGGTGNQNNPPYLPPPSAPSDDTTWNEFINTLEDPDGYTACFAACMVNPKSFADVGGEFGGNKKLAQTYFKNKYPRWFKAGGKYSKVRVPRLKNGLGLMLAVMSACDALECMKACSGENEASASGNQPSSVNVVYSPGGPNNQPPNTVTY